LLLSSPLLAFHLLQRRPFLRKRTYLTAVKVVADN